MDSETKLHVDFCQKFADLGFWTQSEADKEIRDCEIGLKPCTFSVWMRNPNSFALSWFELYRNCDWREIMELWLDNSFDEKDQLRPYNRAQTDLISRSGLIGS